MFGKEDSFYALILKFYVFFSFCFVKAIYLLELCPKCCFLYDLWSTCGRQPYCSHGSVYTPPILVLF